MDSSSIFPHVHQSIKDFMFEEEANIPRSKVLTIGAMMLVLSFYMIDNAFASHRTHSTHSTHRTHSSHRNNGHTTHYTHNSHSVHNNHSTHTTHATHSTQTTHTTHNTHTTHATHSSVSIDSQSGPGVQTDLTRTFATEQPYSTSAPDIPQIDLPGAPTSPQSDLPAIQDITQGNAPAAQSTPHSASPNIPDSSPVNGPGMYSQYTDPGMGTVETAAPTPTPKLVKQVTGSTPKPTPKITATPLPKLKVQATSNPASVTTGTDPVSKVLDAVASVLRGGSNGTNQSASEASNAEHVLKAPIVPPDTISGK